MLQALFGLAGVFLGGLVAWSAQAFQEWRREEGAALGAARTLTVDLLEASAVVDDCISTGSLAYEVESVTRPVGQWEKDRALVARKLSYEELLDVYSGFRVLGRLRRMRFLREQAEEPLGLTENDLLSLTGFREEILAAQQSLLNASRRLEKSLQRRTGVLLRRLWEASRTGRGLPTVVLAVIIGVALSRIYGEWNVLLIYSGGLVTGVVAVVGWVSTAPGNDEERAGEDTTEAQAAGG